MKVILLERVEKLGQMGDVVKVKDGFARNFLLPQEKALRATEENVKRFEARRNQLEAENLTRRSEAEQVAGKVDGLDVVLIRQASDTGQLYGSVTARDIAEQAGAAGVSVDRRQVVLDRPIKTLGIHAIRVNLHPEVHVTIKVNIARSDDEARAQAAGLTPTEGAEAAAAEAGIDVEEAAEAFFDEPEKVTAVLEEASQEEGEEEAQPVEESAASEEEPEEDATKD